MSLFSPADTSASDADHAHPLQTSLEVPPHADLVEAVFDALPIGISVHAEDGLCVYRNAAAVCLGGTDGNAMPTGAAQPGGVGAGTLLETPGPAQANAFEIVTETRIRPLQIGDAHYALRTVQDVTAQRRTERELFDRAFLDDLTGLPNRALLQQSLETLISQAGPDTTFALAFIDLDNFKHINDYYSHAVGDALLYKLGRRLSDMLRPNDLLARIGGDEFMLLLSPFNDIEHLQADIDAVVERLKQPFFIDGHEIFASASMGVSIFPDHGRSYDTLRRNADSAMYRVKSGVKGGAILFNQSMGHAATARMALEQRLRLAIRDRRFCCAVQPKVDLRTHEVTGVEVLLRWRDEQGLIQAPGDFVGLAVELGLMDEITYLVLEETMRVIDAIDSAFGPHISISLNVAAKQAEDVAFMTLFADALAATGCPERFFVELTEEAFMAKGRFQTDVLPKLRAIGARISIDDFGVGFSSLAALADITADELKIDRSFITEIHRRPRSQCVLRAIESLGNGLGMSIIAEGVETFEELAYLQSATRIRYAQGYYFARPMLLESLDGQRLVFQDRAAALNREAAPIRGSMSRSGAGRARF
jgi:diguanylate cyclase (GGDEF)-like protein